MVKKSYHVYFTEVIHANDRFGGEHILWHGE